MSARIGYLGGGNMAQAMVGRLLEAGFAVRLYNRSPEKLRGLEQRGAVVARSPREAAEGAEFVFASVSDDAASRAVWLGAEGALAAALAPGAIMVEHSTLSHGWVLELIGQVRARGVGYVDAPVAGRPDAAAAGQLIVFAGAAAADLAAIGGMIGPISREVFHLGPPGAGTAFKLIYNLMGVAQIVALAEGLAAAAAAGIDLATAARAFAHGNTGSGHVRKHGPFMAHGQHEDPPAFTARGRVKDSRYGVALEEQLGVTPRMGCAALAAYEAMVAAGLGEAADSRLIDVIRGLN